MRKYTNRCASANVDSVLLFVGNFSGNKRTCRVSHWHGSSGAAWDVIADGIFCHTPGNHMAVNPYVCVRVVAMCFSAWSLCHKWDIWTNANRILFCLAMVWPDVGSAQPKYLACRSVQGRPPDPYPWPATVCLDSGAAESQVAPASVPAQDADNSSAHFGWHWSIAVRLLDCRWFVDCFAGCSFRCPYSGRAMVAGVVVGWFAVHSERPPPTLTAGAANWSGIWIWNANQKEGYFHSVRKWCRTWLISSSISRPLFGCWLR